MFKVGDWVVCLPGFNNLGYDNREDISEVGGSGYKEDLIFQIESITTNEYVNGYIAWKKQGSYGIYFRALRLATPWEIEHKQIQKHILYELY